MRDVRHSCAWLSLWLTCALGLSLADALAQSKPVLPSSSPSPKSDASAPPAGAPARTLGVRGITGSLTAFDVEQAMRTRSSALLECVKKSRPRALGYVSGEITFHITLDGKGKVEGVEIRSSDLGHAPLEQCLREVVTTAPFPVPAGAQAAETQWRMSVDPLQRPPVLMDAALLEELLTRESEALYERCEIAKSSRFFVQGYLQRTRKLQPFTVKALRRELPPEQLTCVGETIAKWRGLPKSRVVAKVGFELRFLPAPPPARPRVRARRK